MMRNFLKKHMGLFEKAGVFYAYIALTCGLLIYLMLSINLEVWDEVSAVSKDGMFVLDKNVSIETNHIYVSTNQDDKIRKYEILSKVYETNQLIIRISNQSETPNDNIIVYIPKNTETLFSRIFIKAGKQ